MGEEALIPMNLDLNLGPIPEAPARAVSVEELIDPMERYREVVRVRARQRWRWRQLQASNEQPNLSVDLNQLIVEGDETASLQAGEGSLPPEQGSSELPKTCEPNNGFLQDEKPDKRDELEKSTANDGSLFDCNICFDLATEPVVTCCGHLFCWPCLYQWLHVHSEAKECPVCKGEVAMKNLIPIYGRGSTPKLVPPSAFEIPVRPRARRVESLRQTIQRNPFGIPMEEMIRRIGRRLDLSRDLSPPHEGAEGANAFLSRIMAFRGLRETAPAAGNSQAVDLRETAPAAGNSQAATAQRFHAMLLRRQQTPPRVNPGFASAERLVDAYFGNPRGEAAIPVEDRDSFSSVAAVINSESQVDAAVEIDSMVSSSSRRRFEGSRVSDVDSVDSRAPRRRRLS